MVDPIAPHDIARRTFGVARRGYEQQEVRGFLHEISSLVERLNRAETELRERAERAEARLGMVQQPDEAMLLEVLGEETTRVLTSAREAATEIRTKAEEAAARLIADATAEAAEARAGAVRDADAALAAARSEADALLEQARTELDRRSAEAAEAAAEIRRQGEADAEALRAEARGELVQAQEDAAAERESGRQDGRRMVAEAQVVRERVLRDLAGRRKRARQQVEKLNAGRERLLEAYEVVRRTIDEATTELSVSLAEARTAADAAARRIDEEPEPSIEELDAEVAAAGVEVGDLDHVAGRDDEGAEQAADTHHDDDAPGPLSGEVPAVESAPAEPPAGEAPTSPRVIAVEHGRGRKRRKKGFDGLPPAELTVVEPPVQDEGVRVLADQPAPEGEPSEQPVVAATPDVDPTGAEAEAAAPEADSATAPAPEPEAASLPDPGVEPEADAAAGAAADEDATPERDPDAIFARLREGAAEGGDVDTAPEEAGAEPSREDAGDPDDAAGTDEAPTTDEGPGEDEARSEDEARPFAARAAALGSVEKDLARRLKRGLADEQNEVLDLLRRAKPKGVDDVLPAAEQHTATWAALVSTTLAEAAAAGADWSGGKASAADDLATELAESLTAPLRERIDRSFVASDGNLDDVADRVRALYREWKGQRLRETCAHYAGAAYARGLFDGIGAKARVHWVVDPSAGPCPDCDDNVLAGAIVKGEDFPTGNPCAPAHPGCHCLVLPVEG